jgi:hypothetical protein
MNANDACQAVCRRERERRSFEQSSHQAFSEKMKKHVKLVSNEKSTQSLRDAAEKYHVKKNEIA